MNKHLDKYVNGLYKPAEPLSRKQAEELNPFNPKSGYPRHRLVEAFGEEFVQAARGSK